MGNGVNPPTFAVGDFVVLFRGGLGRIRELVANPSEHWVIEVGDATTKVSVAEQALHMRTAMPLNEARSLFERLCHRDERGARASRDGTPELTSLRQFARCSPAEKAEYLRLLYGSPKRLSANERHIAVTEEHSLLGELAFVLGVPLADLRDAARRGDPTLAPRPPVPSVVPFELPGCKRLGAFTVGGRLVAAEPGYARDAKRHRARRGMWHAFVRHDEEGSDRNAALLVVHDGQRADVVRLLAAATKIDTAGVDGAVMSIVDGDALADDLFVAETLDRVGHEGMLGDRGCTCMSGDGDGTYPVRGVRDGVELVLVVVAFD